MALLLLVKWLCYYWKVAFFINEAPRRALGDKEEQ